MSYTHASRPSKSQSEPYWGFQSGSFFPGALCNEAQNGHRRHLATGSWELTVDNRIQLLPPSRIASAAREALATCGHEDVLQALEPFRCQLRAQAWTLLLSDCAKRGEYHKAWSVFNTVPQKNVWHYSALIAALGACGEWKEALAELQHLKILALDDSSLQPNHVTYSAAIAACARAQQLQFVLQMFKEMEDDGIKPDAVTFHIVLSCAVRQGAWREVKTMLSSMHSQGIPARPPIYSAYIRHLCKDWSWNEALTVYLIMQDLGVEPTAALVADLLQGFLQCHKYGMAVILLKQAEQCQLVSSVYLYDCALTALLQAGRTSMAEELYGFMKQTGRWPERPAFAQRLQEVRAATTTAGRAETAESSSTLHSSWLKMQGGTTAAGGDAPADSCLPQNSCIGSAVSGVTVDVEECLDQCLVSTAEEQHHAAGTDEYAASNVSSADGCSPAVGASIVPSNVSSSTALSEVLNCSNRSCGSSVVASPARSPTANIATAAAAGTAAKQLQVCGRYITPTPPPPKQQRHRLHSSSNNSNNASDRRQQQQQQWQYFSGNMRSGQYYLVPMVITSQAAGYYPYEAVMPMQLPQQQQQQLQLQPSLQYSAAAHQQQQEQLTAFGSFQLSGSDELARASP